MLITILSLSYFCFAAVQTIPTDLQTLQIRFSKLETKRNRELNRLTPPSVQNYTSIYRNRKFSNRSIPEIRDWFPLGVYAGDYGNWDFVIDDLKLHHCNTLYVNSFDNQQAKFGKLLDLVEKAGIRIILQNHNPDGIYIKYLGGKKRFGRNLNQQIQHAMDVARKFMPRFKDRWGLLCYSVSDEAEFAEIPGIKKLADLGNRIAPAQPVIALYQTLSTAKRVMQGLKSPILMVDSYPLKFDERCGPTEPGAWMKLYTERLDAFYRIAKSAGARFWLVTQGFGQQRRSDSVYGFRTPSINEIKLQAWLALGHGATGIIFFGYYYPDRGVSGLYMLRGPQWGESQMWKGVGQVFSQIEKVAPIMLKTSRINERIAVTNGFDYGMWGADHFDDGHIETNFFKFDIPELSEARIIVAVNTDVSAEHKLQMRILQRIGKSKYLYDLIANRKVGIVQKQFDWIRDFDKQKQSLCVKIKPGEARVYLLGNDKDFAVCNDLVLDD